MVLMRGNCTRSICWLRKCTHYSKAVNSRIVQKSGWICCLIPDSRELPFCFYTLGLLHLDFSCWTSSEIFNEAPTFIPVMLAICSFDSVSNLWPSIPYKTNKILQSSILPSSLLIISTTKKRDKFKKTFLHALYNKIQINYHFDKAFAVQGTVVRLQEIADVRHGPLIRRHSWLTCR